MESPLTSQEIGWLRAFGEERAIRPHKRWPRIPRIRLQANPFESRRRTIGLLFSGNENARWRGH
ncbi:hypothetical protein [Burkholderia sp. MSMB1826]|uniref:hypothetical protein n=1 Tax=Burkholderia sp. MSMB1826 TaxID=1637875 RepID=UPI0012E3F4D7|nr:hypothetical protein [Burkholderia sp. MSMB1826]